MGRKAVFQCVVFFTKQARKRPDENERHAPATVLVFFNVNVPSPFALFALQYNSKVRLGRGFSLEELKVRPMDGECRRDVFAASAPFNGGLPFVQTGFIFLQEPEWGGSDEICGFQPQPAL